MKRMMQQMLAAAALAGLWGLAPAGRAQDLAVTIYNQNFALVKDVRVMDLEKGTYTARLDDVAAGIDATSVHIKALDHPGGVAVLEQNFQYDLAGADRLLDRYLNREVSVALNDGGAAQGTLLSYDGGNLVLSRNAGAVILSRKEVRDIQLGEVPGGLVVKPTLEWMLDSDRAGKERMEVSYLTDGVNWHAEYVAVVNPKDTGLDLSGWVSIDNQSGATYKNAKLKLVAGDVNRVQEPTQFRPFDSTVALEAKRAPQFESGDLFEYHVYTLQRPATLADRETKQLTLFPGAEAKVQKVLTYDRARYGDDVRVTLEFDNSRANNLGMPLPAGKVRVFKQDTDGAMEFVGEDRVDHTPKDEEVRLYIGNSFDVKAERNRDTVRKISDRVHEETYTIKVRNHKQETARVVVVEHLRGLSWSIVQESRAHTQKDAYTVEYVVDVAPDTEETVTYTARIEN